MRVPHSIQANWSKTTAFMVFLSLAIAQGEISLGQSTTTPKGIVTTPAKQRSKKFEYLRTKTNSKGELVSLQTSITRFKSATGDTIVDLIGAVHIGERGYYQKLNKQFDLYDVVLYELVAPEGTRVPRGGKKQSSGNPIGFLQSSMQKMLGLESQLSLVDYQKENFEHADMSPAQIGKKMEERGETPFSVGMSALSEMMKNQKQMSSRLASENNDLASSLANEGLFELMGNPLKLKRLLASQFTNAGVMETGMGETLNKMLIDDRNAAAMKVLKREMNEGKKHIAIFYGAAHMPDFQERLNDELKMKPTKQVWLDAWDLTKAPSKSSSPMGLMMDMLRQMD